MSGGREASSSDFVSATSAFRQIRLRCASLRRANVSTWLTTSRARSPALRISVRLPPGTTLRVDVRLGGFRVSQDCADDVVEVMSDAARQGANSLHPARLLQVRGQALALTVEKLPVDRVGDGVECQAQQSRTPPCR